MAEVKMEKTSLDGTDLKPKDKKSEPKGEIERRKPEPVAKAKVAKQSVASRFIDTLGLEDGRTVGDYLLWDVIVPATKDLISSIFKQGIDIFLYGTNRPKNIERRGQTSRVSYGRYYEEPRRMQSGRQHKDPSYSGRGMMDFTTIRWYDYTDSNGHLVTGREQAEQVLDEMIETIDMYEFCRVSDFLSFAQVPESEVNFTDHSLGWDRLGTAGAQRSRDGGWYLSLPRPIANE